MVKKRGIVFVGMLGVLLIAPRLVYGGDEHVYVGVKKCTMCHKKEKRGNQVAKWKETKHSHAYEVLGTAKAKKMGAERGVSDPQKSPKCLKCHVTGYGLPAARFASSFKAENGIQCETCHGAGKDYKKMRIMKDLEKAKANGLILPTKEVCVKCHNKESPGYKPFCFAHFYAKIAHPDPSRKGKARTIKCTCDKKEDLKIDENGKMTFEKQVAAPKLLKEKA